MRRWKFCNFLHKKLGTSSVLYVSNFINFKCNLYRTNSIKQWNMYYCSYFANLFKHCFSFKATLKSFDKAISVAPKVLTSSPSSHENQEAGYLRVSTRSATDAFSWLRQLRDFLNFAVQFFLCNTREHFSDIQCRVYANIYKTPAAARLRAEGTCGMNCLNIHWFQEILSRFMT